MHPLGVRKLKKYYSYICSGKNKKDVQQRN